MTDLEQTDRQLTLMFETRHKGAEAMRRNVNLQFARASDNNYVMKETNSIIFYQVFYLFFESQILSIFRM